MTIVVDGRAIQSSAAPMIVGGTVAVPVDPFLRSIAGTISVEDDTIVFVRGAASVVVRLGQRAARLGPASVTLPIAPYLRDGSAFIPLAAVARALGASVTFDTGSKTVSVALPAGQPLATPSPYVPASGAGPQLPFRTDPTAAPRPTETGIPQPRRTPIEVNP